MSRPRVLAAAALAALAVAAGAAAHGDPTADYLASYGVLSSYASPPARTLDLQLLGLVQASTARGYPIKVSLIASSYDTGGDAEPLASPQWYAQHVRAELAAAAPLRAPILIVTPKAFGLAGPQPRNGALRPLGGAEARRLLDGIPLPGKADGDALARAAMTAVRRLARDAGRPLPRYVPPARVAPVPPAPEDGDERWQIAVALGLLPVLGLLVFGAVRAATRARPVPD